MKAVAGSVGEAIAAAADALAAAGVETPRLDAEVLLAAATGRERLELVAEPGAALAAAPGRAFGEMVRRRLRREPVAYVVGAKGFRHIELHVDRRVLIPRPETEMLVEVALEERPARVLDVGTGSGAIALAVAQELPGCSVTATDTSSAALEVARGNAERLGLSERVRFLEATLPDDGAFDLLLANLPYVAERDWGTLQPELTRWEPREAMLAGPDGLDAYRALGQSLADRGSGRVSSRNAGTGATAFAKVVAVEVGEGQAGAVAAMLRAAGFGEAEARRDLAGIERVVVARATDPAPDGPVAVGKAGEQA